ncbi:MAG: hypothetical protein CSA05_01880 [Bacteroidia bacterium]|nr:MAG: hypothetical protein CSA05_01880 [Bacteroidia bacterium]
MIRSKQTIRIFLLTAIFACAILQDNFAQKVPQSINYQAIARDDNDNPIINQEIVVEITILSEMTGGEIIWQEVHKTETNNFGIFTLLIGKGTSTTRGKAPHFSSIWWAKGEYYLQTRVDFGKKEFGNGLVDMGIVQLQSVPYALVADSAIHVNMKMDEISDVNISGLNKKNGLNWDGSKWTPTMFVNADGTTDLTGDWKISSNNITLNGGKLTTRKFQIGNSTEISSIVTSINADNPSNNKFVTEKAVAEFAGGGGGVWIEAFPALYDLNHNIGIGTSAPEAKFHADVTDDQFLITGTYESTGKGRWFFNPRKAVVRGGFVSSGSVAWNESYLGNFSAAFGKDNQASGDFSFSMGESNASKGEGSFTMGKGNEVTKKYAVAFGENNKVVNFRAFALGQNNEVGGVAASAFGYGNTCNGPFSMTLGESNTTQNLATGSAAIGKENQAYGKGSMALGEQTNTNGDCSLAFGSLTMTEGSADGSIAGGLYSYTIGMYSSAFGIGTNASSYGEFAIGQFNTLQENASKSSWNTADRAFVVGNGTSSGAASDAFVVMKSGYVGIRKSKPSQALDVNGSIVASGSISGSSDRRFKKKLSPLQNSLRKIEKLDAFYYFWKTKQFPKRDFSENRQIGMIAQDVEKVFPELVVTGTDGYKAIDYGKLSVVLLDALKEQQKEIEKLKKQNNNLKNQLTGADKKYSELNKRLKKIEALLETNAKK